ncbi:MAG: hypothetical protein JWO48_501 [Bryobacterales bacterium]|jgi:hypothetical protein|nr:hypothetical protein [Bryobacterales bacterium]
MVAKYKLLEKAFIRPDGHLEASLREPGEEIEFSGLPHRLWQPLNAEAVSALAQIKPLSDSAKNIAPRRGDPP